VGKSDVLEHKSSNISETRKLRKSYNGGPIGSHQRSFERYHPRPPMASSSQDWGFATPTQNFKRYYFRNGLNYGYQIWPLHSQGPSLIIPLFSVEFCSKATCYNVLQCTNSRFCVATNLQTVYYNIRWANISGLK